MISHFLDLVSKFPLLIRDCLLELLDFLNLLHVNCLLRRLDYRVNLFVMHEALRIQILPKIELETRWVRAYLRHLIGTSDTQQVDYLFEHLCELKRALILKIIQTLLGPVHLIENLAEHQSTWLILFRRLPSKWNKGQVRFIRLDQFQQAEALGQNVTLKIISLFLRGNLSLHTWSQTFNIFHWCLWFLNELLFDFFGNWFRLRLILLVFFDLLFHAFYNVILEF